jgi:hypothetical protein
MKWNCCDGKLVVMSGKVRIVLATYEASLFSRKPGRTEKLAITREYTIGLSSAACNIISKVRP